MALLEIEVDIHLIGDLLRAGAGVFQSGKGLVHFGRRADEELVALHLHPPLVASQAVGIDAQEHVMASRVFLVQIVGVIRRHQRDSHLPREVDCSCGAESLNFESRILDFEVIVVAEQLAIPGDHLFGLVHSIAENQRRELPRGAARQADEPLVMQFE